MFFNKKKIEFSDMDDQYFVFSLFDRKIGKFYSLVLDRDIQRFKNGLCRVYDMSSDEELLKSNLENLDIYSLGRFNAINGFIQSKIEYLGKLSDLILDFKKKQLKGGNVNETKKD